MRNSIGLISLGVCIVIATAIFAMSGRYSAGTLSSGTTWKLDRLTGKLIYCGVTGCVEPKL